MLPGTEKNKFPKADPERTVKSFSRSAAGKIKKQSDLRPPLVLQRTVNYLLFEYYNRKWFFTIINEINFSLVDNTDVPWHVIYDFITDRLLEVRQDMVIQNVSEIESIGLLQPIVRFHAFAHYRLCNEKMDYFDPVLNKGHLQECLKKLLQMYDNYELSSFINGDKSVNDIFYRETRKEFEALYITLNLDKEESLQRALNLPNTYKYVYFIMYSLPYYCGNG